MTDEVQLDTSFPKYVFIDGIPVVGKDKYLKLQKVLESFFKKNSGDFQNLVVPESAEGGTKG